MLVFINRSMKEHSAYAIASVVAFLACFGGCSPDMMRSMFSSGNKTTERMTFVSNQENTTFSIRRANGGVWRPAGTGKIVDVEVYSSTPYEVKAKPVGYRQKTMTITQPVRELRFTFEISDRLDEGGKKGLPHIACDIRLVAVGTGYIVAQARGFGERGKLAEMAVAVAVDLQKAMPPKGSSVAVVSLRNRSNTEIGATVCEELADKITGALVAGKWFNVKERIDLRKLVDEKDLDAAGIVRNPHAKQMFTGVDYLVIGGVSVPDSEWSK